MPDLTPCRMTGRCRTGEQRDGGRLYHAVDGTQKCGWGKALCGARPGAGSLGWSDYPGEKITCPKCLKKLEKITR